MDINTVDFYSELKNTVSNAKKISGSEFKELFSQITGGKMAEEIRNSYNVTLDVGNICDYQQLISTYDIRCTNYVQISSETLSNMENNPALKRKILSAIQEFCSPEEQTKVNALSPPVKSAGMIIYPDGSALYWLEGYPNEVGYEKDKKIVGEKSISMLFQSYADIAYQVSENNLESVMQMVATGYKRK